MILSEDRFVVTNYHVIKDSDLITVVLSDRREFEAKIVGTDERTDLAVLRLATEGKSCPFFPWATPTHSK